MTAPWLVESWLAGDAAAVGVGTAGAGFSGSALGEVGAIGRGKACLAATVPLGLNPFFVGETAAAAAALRAVFATRLFAEVCFVFGFFALVFTVTRLLADLTALALPVLPADFFAVNVVDLFTAFEGA